MAEPEQPYSYDIELSWYDFPSLVTLTFRGTCGQAYLSTDEARALGEALIRAAGAERSGRIGPTWWAASIRVAKEVGS